jgi:cytochrome o ubiquinol oxidase subunit 1
MIGSYIARTFDEDTDYYVPAAEVERIETARFDQLDALRASKTGAL